MPLEQQLSSTEPWWSRGISHKVGEERPKRTKPGHSERVLKIAFEDLVIVLLVVLDFGPFSRTRTTTTTRTSKSVWFSKRALSTPQRFARSAKFRSRPVRNVVPS